MGLLGTMSAIGTALGPSLGGLLIGTLGWPSIFLAMLPAALVTLGLSAIALKPTVPAATRPRIDIAGTALLAVALGAYALSMTTGRGAFGLLNLLLLGGAAVGLALFLVVEARVAAPLLRLSLFRLPGLGAGFATSALVSTVMMTTLVVGPFYLARALGLDSVGVGLVMSAGPVVSALSGLPAGRLVDRFGALRMSLAGLCGILGGSLLLAFIPATGIPGYILPLVLTTASYALFQAANNTAVMTAIAAGERGLVSGVLNLSRNLGLVTGASAMGAVFALGAAAPDLAHAAPDAAATGMRLAFATAAGLMLAALAIAAAARRR
jgi:MFS family permease